MLWTVRYDYEPGWKLKKHSHDYHQMLYILSGSGEYIIENRIFPISKGKLFYIKPNQAHSLVTDPARGDTVKTLDIKFYVNDKELENKIKEFESEIVLEDNHIPELLKKIRREGLEKESYYNEISVIYLLEIIFQICRIHENIKNNIENKNAGKKTDIIEHEEGCNICDAFMEYIKEHYMEDLTLKKIARETGYNQSYICQQLKEVYNCTPMTLLYKFRINKAKELIVNTDYGLKEISELVGFKTIHHFTRKFKEYQGLNPGEFRDRERHGIRKDVYFNDNFVNRDITIKSTPDLNHGQKK